MSVRGSVDSITSQGIAGWAYAPHREEKVVVHAMLNHEIVGDAVANVHRPDLAAAGLGNGECGYKIRFYREIDPLYLPFITLTVDGGDIELPRVSLAVFREFFAALYRVHPAAGRPRTVFGGLWTDRTDSAALLKGKVEIGQISPDTASVIAQFIHAGIAIIEFVDFRAAPAGEITSQLIDSLLGHSTILPVLQAVLEDVPCVVRAEAVGQLHTELLQPSTEAGLSSPAECLAIVMPLPDKIEIDVVRDSHTLPEFTRNGMSRWANGAVDAGVEIAADQQGLMDRYEISSGSVAMIGPGLLYKLRGRGEADGLRLLCAPGRALPMKLVNDSARREIVGDSGVRIWL